MITKEIASKLHELNHTLTGIAFSLAMSKDDKITVYERQNQPCYGEMRTYGKGSVPPEREKDYKPGDLHSPFPKGTPEGVGVPIRTSFSADTAIHNEFMEWLFSKESPWATGIDQIEFTKNKSGKNIGIVQTDTNFDPTVFVNLLKSVRGYYNRGSKWSEAKKKFGLNNFQAFLLSFSNIANYDKLNVPTFLLTPGCFYGVLDLERFRNKNPYDKSGGLTFKQRSAYNRPEIEYIFSEKGVNTPQTVFGVSKTLNQHIEFVKTL